MPNFTDDGLDEKILALRCQERLSSRKIAERIGRGHQFVMYRLRRMQKAGINVTIRLPKMTHEKLKRLKALLHPKAPDAKKGDR